MIRMLLMIAALILPVAARAANPALAQDGALYAARYGLSQADAESELAALEESHARTDAIAARLGQRVAGISVRHKPALTVEVLLTGDRVEPDTTFVARDGRRVPIHFRTGAKLNRRALVLAIYRGQAALKAAFRDARGLGVDPRTGSLVLYLRDAPDDAAKRAELAAKASAIMAAPVAIARADQRPFDFSVEGGGRVIGPVDGKLYACTTGFLVTNGIEQAVTTAAHCPDELTYQGTDGTQTALPFIGQWGARAYDVQLNRVVSGQGARFFADRKALADRQVSGWRNRASLRGGDWLCHWGEKSGYACAEVELTDYAPPGDLCAGPCEPLFATLAGPQCGSGDSGGPIFIGTTAVGLIKGGSKGVEPGSCNFSYFQSIDYLPPGWRLVVSPPTKNGAG